jgi:hypothetical protein
MKKSNFLIAAFGAIVLMTACNKDDIYETEHKVIKNDSSWVDPNNGDPTDSTWTGNPTDSTWTGNPTDSTWTGNPSDSTWVNPKDSIH